jgi:hypothetical protein
VNDTDLQVRQSLERLTRRAEDVERDWGDVLRRVEHRRRRSFVVALVVAAGLATGVGTAFGFGPELWRIVTGTPVNVKQLSAEEKQLLASMSSGRAIPRTEPDAKAIRNLGQSVSIRLLDRRGRYTFYVVDVHGRRKFRCFATGKANEPVLLGGLMCPYDNRFPSRQQPILDASAFWASQTGSGVSRLAGFAADAVTEVGFLDLHRKVVASVPVIKNTYLRATGLPINPQAIVAFTRSGVRVYCQNIVGDPCHNGQPIARAPLHVAQPYRPPPARTVRRPAGKLTQRGSAEGVTVAVYAPGIAIFDLRKLTSRVHALLGAGFGYGCLRVRFFKGRWLSDGSGFSSAFAPLVSASVYNSGVQSFGTTPTGVPPPYDGCALANYFGHFWNDTQGTHDAVEIPLTPKGRLFFQERGVARDLAYFVRSVRVQKIRLSASPAAALRTLAQRHPGRVVELQGQDQLPPPGAVGFWIGSDQLVFAEATPRRHRLFVVAKRQSLKILEQNFGDLAFVF